MIHQFRDKNKIEKKKRIIKNIIFVIIFLIFTTYGIFSYTGGFFHKIGKPIWLSKNNIIENISDKEYLIKTKKSVFKENANLIKENEDLKNEMLDYQLLKNDNLKFKEFFGRIPIKKDLTMATVLTKPSYSPYDTIIIDMGEENGLRLGNKVYANNITPIGFISIVYDNTSLVTLYSNPGQKTQVMMDESNIILELIGRGGGNFDMNLPIDLPLLINSLVYLPNIESEIVGIIKETISLPSDPIKKVLLISPVNIQNLKWVFVDNK